MRAGFVAVTALLVAVGCSRPVLPDLLRSRWGLVVLVLAVAGTFLGALAARRRAAGDGYEGALIALLPLALAAMYLQPQRIASDGIFYYAPLHSIVIDLDLDFTNEYRVLGAEPGYFQRTETGRLPNNYSVGPAILWAPCFLVAHAFALLGAYRPTGFGYPYFTAVATGTVLIGLGGVVALFRLVRDYYPERYAFTAVLFTWLATFHLWYMTFEPSMSHAQAMASVSLYFLLTHRGVTGLRGFALMGALGGVVALVRWQNVVLLPVTLVVTWMKKGRPKPVELLVGGAAFLAVFSPQLLYWKMLYGSFLLVPQGGGYIDWGAPEIEGLFFSSRHGLFAWAPILYLALLGFAGFLRRAPAFAWGLLLSALVVTWVNGSVYDWWAGASFGSRRFDGVLPAFALGLAAFVTWAVPRVASRPLVAVGIALTPFVLWNGLLMGVYFAGTVPPDGPASFRRAAADGIELLYPRLGYPFSWPAAWLRRFTDGWPPGAYDLLGSQSLSNNVDVRMGDTDALFLGRGWSLPIRGRGATHREVAPGGAEVFLLLNEPAPYTVAVWGRGGRAAVYWNDVRVGDVSLEAGAEPGRLTVEPRHVRPGPNAVFVVPEGGASLAVERLRFSRPGDPP